LTGYEIEREKVQAKIAEIQSQLGGRNVVNNDGVARTGRRRPLSPAARQRIAAAQKKRWAAYHKQQSQRPAATQKTTAVAKPKRKMSPARRAALVANLKKAREPRAAKRAAA
jgi:hypothetical protein